jgi:hypothetical protein
MDRRERGGTMIMRKIRVNKMSNNNFKKIVITLQRVQFGMDLSIVPKTSN